MPEPLKDKKLWTHWTEICEDKEEVHSDNPACVFDFDDVKSACEFYLRYKCSPELLIKEHPELKKELFEFLNAWNERSKRLTTLDIIDMDELLEEIKQSIEQGDFLSPLFPWKEYEEWLFKLAFKDVFEGEQR